VGRHSAISNETRYELDGLGIQTQWEQDVSHNSRLALGPTRPPIQWVSDLFPEDKAARAWHWPPIPMKV